MEKPNKKQKRAILVAGVTGAVYLSFKYLLPLVIPFLIAYVIALGIRPLALWCHKKLHLPVGISAGIIILIMLSIILTSFYFGIKRLADQVYILIERMPEYIQTLDQWLTGFCHNMEQVFRLKDDILVKNFSDMLLELGKQVKVGIMPFVMGNSLAIFKCIIEISAITIIILIAIILSLKEMDNLRDRKNRSVFRMEFALLSNRLISVGSAYIKTQGIIMLTTTIICIGGLMLIKNPYNILLGICIGLLDALPIFGTGTVLIPWAIFSLVTGKISHALVLVIIYITCYFLREIMEAKLMGEQVGISPWETLIAMYVGLQLFGLLGFILGPIGLLIIQDIVEAYSINT